MLNYRKCRQGCQKVEKCWRLIVSLAQIHGRNINDNTNIK
jgi:hypothetical protein